MQKLAILKQIDPYNTEFSRFAVCGTIDGRGSSIVLSNQKTRKIASEWTRTDASVRHRSLPRLRRLHSQQRTTASKRG